MAEMYLTLHHVPAEFEDAVRSLLAERFEEYPDSDQALTSDQASAYNAGTYEADTVARTLADLGVSFKLAYRSDDDGVYLYTPDLGMRMVADDGTGTEMIPVNDVLALADLSSIEEVRAQVARITGQAWDQALAAMDAARA